MGDNVHTKTVSLSFAADLLRAMDARCKSLAYRRRAHYLTHLFDEDARESGDHVREPNYPGRTGAKVAVTFNFPKETLLAADRRAALLGYRKRSHYATFIVERDLLAAGPHTRTPRPITPVRRKLAS